MQRRIMSGQTDLKQAVQDLAEAVQSATAEISAQLAIITAGNSSDADQEAAAQAIEAQVTNLKAAVASTVPPVTPST